mgnify:CR=1 FL=1
MLVGTVIGADVMLVTSLLFSVGATPSQAGSRRAVNQPPTVRHVIVEWTTCASGQDKFEPDLMVINQGVLSTSPSSTMTRMLTRLQ